MILLKKKLAVSKIKISYIWKMSTIHIGISVTKILPHIIPHIRIVSSSIEIPAYVL